MIHTRLTVKIFLNYTLFLVAPVVEASSTMNGKDITYPTLQQAIYSLTAFLNVRDFFFRFSEDLVVTFVVTSVNIFIRVWTKWFLTCYIVCMKLIMILIIIFVWLGHLVDDRFSPDLFNRIKFFLDNTDEVLNRAYGVVKRSLDICAYRRIVWILYVQVRINSCTL